MTRSKKKCHLIVNWIFFRVSYRNKFLTFDRRSWLVCFGDPLRVCRQHLFSFDSLNGKLVRDGIKLYRWHADALCSRYYRPFPGPFINTHFRVSKENRIFVGNPQQFGFIERISHWDNKMLRAGFSCCLWGMKDHVVWAHIYKDYATKE